MATRAAGAMQTKLLINKPGDEYEQEADRVSEQVMSMPEPRLQRACSRGEECSKRERLQPMSAAMPTFVGPHFGHDFSRVRVDVDPPAPQSGEAVVARAYTAAPNFRRPVVCNRPDVEVPPIVHDVLRSPGQPLEPAARTFMESRFGHDFSKVQVRTDARAAESARGGAGPSLYGGAERRVWCLAICAGDSGGEAVAGARARPRDSTACWRSGLANVAARRQEG
jgi:Domain of unknown function (DUF4157)